MEYTGRMEMTVLPVARVRRKTPRQLQPFIAVFTQACAGQLASSGPTRIFWAN